MSKIAILVILICITAPAYAKEAGVFYPASMVAKARANMAKDPWAAEQKKLIIEAAKPWMNMSDDELWSLMFGPTIHRSWMVWSNGHCPACKQSVPMYNWAADAMNVPWKMRCPHCKELFPKNDFGAFYRSGLDEHGVFDPKLADRPLLFNTEHPDPNDPLHMFGVDDGTGYVEGDKRWRFIGAYLIRGPWKQAVMGGINNLSMAYLVTGDRKYARKAGILLDRVADLYPMFDFDEQADVYEKLHPGHGYVSVWHDACGETRQLALGYDMIFDGIRDDKALVTFLSRKARKHKLENPKSSFEDIQRNIEDRILRDALVNRRKIESNYPTTDITFATIEAILGWPESRDRVNAILDPMLTKATAVDGVTGEKGLTAYSSYTIAALASMLGQFSRIDPGFLENLLERHPRIHQMYRFHIDTWSFCKHYPFIGDAGGFGRNSHTYVGMAFEKGIQSTPKFMWDLYELTGDTAFVQMIYLANKMQLDGLPYDLFSDDPKAFQKKVGDVIAKVGPYPEQKSVNKQEWRLAILRSGNIDSGRALWLHYDAMGNHRHHDHMNLGLFAKGLDLMPDFGYKPVNYGGWSSPRAYWYGKPPAHNTVSVDGKDTVSGAGTTTLWADGKQFRAIRASGPQPVGAQQFERTAALIDISDKDSYIFDVFRVVGGKDHAKFMGSHFGTITTQGLTLKPAEEYGHEAIMRNFMRDDAPEPGWSVDWDIEDRYKYTAEGSDVHLRYTDLTIGAQAYTAEAWILAGGYATNDEVWIPRIVTRRQSAEAPLASTFVAIIEPYNKKSSIKSIRRLALQAPDGEAYGDAHAAVEVRLANGRRDLLVSMDVENPLGLKPAAGIVVQKDWGLRTDAELCLVRKNAYGKVSRIVVCKGSFLEIGDTNIKLDKRTDLTEAVVQNGKVIIPEER